MCPVVYFCSESLLYLMETVHSGQMVRRSHPDKDPNGRLLIHFGAVSDRECSGESAVTN